MAKKTNDEHKRQDEEVRGLAGRVPAGGRTRSATDTAWAPWSIARTDDKKRGRLNIISHLLSQIPYQPLARRGVTLPIREKIGDYVEPHLRLRCIPMPF